MGGSFSGGSSFGTGGFSGGGIVGRVAEAEIVSSLMRLKTSKNMRAEPLIDHNERSFHRTMGVG
jgi:hypothetical protein